MGLTVTGMSGATAQLLESCGSEREEGYPKQLFPDRSTSGQRQSVAQMA